MASCGCCGKSASKDGLDSHHIIPQNVGGTETIDICSTCHTNTHKLAHMMRGNDIEKVASFLEENYPSKDSIHQLLIRMAQTIIMEEESGVKTEINIPYKPTVEIHKKLKDMAKQSKVSMTKLLDELIVSEWRRRNYGEKNHPLKR